MDTEENDGGYCTKPDSRRKGSLDTTVAVSRKLVLSCQLRIQRKCQDQTICDPKSGQKMT